jgi:hypothetical protein
MKQEDENEETKEIYVLQGYESKARTWDEDHQKKLSGKGDWLTHSQAECQKRTY